MLCVVVAFGLFGLGLYVDQSATKAVEQSQPAEIPGERPLTSEELAEIQRQDVEAQQWDSQDDPDSPEISSGQVGALPSRDEWIGKFNKAKRSMVKHGKPLCEGCGRSPEECGKVSHDAHHVISVERIETEVKRDGAARWAAETKWDADNLIILCRPSMSSRTDPADKGCHCLLGHCGESWHVSDPDVRKHAAEKLKRIHPKKTYDQLVEEYFENQPQAVPQSTGEKRARSNTQAKRTLAP